LFENVKIPECQLKTTGVGRMGSRKLYGTSGIRGLVNKEFDAEADNPERSLKLVEEYRSKLEGILRAL